MKLSTPLIGTHCGKQELCGCSSTSLRCNAYARNKIKELMVCNMLPVVTNERVQSPWKLLAWVRWDWCRHITVNDEHSQATQASPSRHTQVKASRINFKPELVSTLWSCASKVMSNADPLLPLLRSSRVRLAWPANTSMKSWQAPGFSWFMMPRNINLASIRVKLKLWKLSS